MIMSPKEGESKSWAVVVMKWNGQGREHSRHFKIMGICSDSLASDVTVSTALFSFSISGFRCLVKFAMSFVESINLALC